MRNMKKYLKKGIITLQTVLWVAGSISACLGVYFANVIAANDAITKTEKVLTTSITDNTNEITKNTTNIANMLRTLEKMDGKLDKLLEQ